MKKFNKPFTQQESISPLAVTAANKVLESGRIHRYNVVPGEFCEVDHLEMEFARYMASPYCLACSSGGYALHIAMRAAGVKPGDKVLSNAFTLAPVPGAIHNSGAEPVLVEMDESYCIDLADLELKTQSSGAKYFMLSHMRGHIADMDEIMRICERYSLVLIEDCAHTMGANWRGTRSGSFGHVACFSTQTYKHINSGEGGLLISEDAELMAKAIMYSGSYMLFSQHQAAPEPEVFERIRLETPNYSGRMDNLRAAILRPQLQDLDQQCERWNSRYEAVEKVLNTSSMITVPNRSEHEYFVGSSIQFSLNNYSAAQIMLVVQQCEQRGVSLKWFGDPQPKGYTSRYDSWQYIDDMPHLSKTEKILNTLMDMRIPLTFDRDDCQLIGEIIVDVVDNCVS